jgi:methionine sulfoxide reductase heme-binding subunit
VSELLWYLSRAAGVVGLCLVTAVLVLGLLTSGARRPTGQRTTLVVALHRWLALGVVAFLAVHVVTAVADGFVDIGWLAVVLPFTSGYAAWQVALGTLALDCLVALVATSLLRHRLSERVWRGVHWLAFAMWPLAVVHGLVLGTSDQWLLRATTVACAVVGAVAVAWRLTATHADHETRRRVAAQGWS